MRSILGRLGAALGRLQPVRRVADVLSGLRAARQRSAGGRGG